MATRYNSKNFIGEFYSHDEMNGKRAAYIGHIYKVAKNAYRIVRFQEFSNTRTEFESAEFQGSDFRRFTTFNGINFYTAP